MGCVIDKETDKINQNIKNYFIGKSISQIRKSCGFSVQQTAHCLQISEKDLLLYECGEKEIDCSLLVNLSYLFNVSVDDFFLNLKAFNY